MIRPASETTIRAGLRSIVIGKGRELLDDLVANSPQRQERAVRAACRSIEARIELWNGTLCRLRNSRDVEPSIERKPPGDPWSIAAFVGQA
jgi:hypothetical protein